MPSVIAPKSDSFNHLEGNNLELKTYMFIRTISDTAKAKRALCFSKAVSS